MVRELILGGQLASAAVWAFVALLPYYRDTLRGPGARAYTVFSLGFAAYSFADFLYLMAPTPDLALWFLRARWLAITPVPLFCLFFARWLYVRRVRRDLLLAVPTAVLAVLATVFQSVSVTPTEWGYSPVRYLPLYVVWVGHLYLYWGAALYYMGREVRKMKGLEEFADLRARLLAVIVSLAGVIVGALLGNSYFTLQQAHAPPLLSALLVIPGVVLLTVALPVSRETISAFVKRTVIQGKQVRHAFLVYAGGTLIASRSQAGDTESDEDIFAAIFEALQQYAHFGLAPFDDGWLGAVEYGDRKILVERGLHSYLVLVTTGREDDLLRNEARELLARFERGNAHRLRDWSGDAADLQHAKDTVDFLFEMDKFF